MNSDTLQDIMLYLPYEDVLAMCSSYQFGNQACNDTFWKNKMIVDFNMMVPHSNIPYKEKYKRLHDIHILVNQFFMFLEAQLDGTQDFYANHQYVILSLPNHGYFFGDLYEMVFIITKENNDYDIEIIYSYDHDQTEEPGTMQQLKELMIDLMYKHPDLIVQDLSGDPILYHDLLASPNTNKKNKLLKIWQDVKSINK